MQEGSYDSQFGVMRIGLIVGFFVVAYMLYNLTVSIYDNYQIEQHIAEFEKKNTELESENKEKLEDLQYFTSDEYIEKVAKQNLGLIKPGEKVIIIPEDDLVVLTQSEDTAALAEELRASWSTPKKWWKFFFSYNPYKA
ncbi:septum formation initiator family protein [Candidatus Peregrinibacteria bacterium]|jgi:cell division protein FtsB|nr:septum formation initiator family protein [Candidatus Peregrinibacteria bacterium]MBT4631557.1 septum formation initiator family protein [Candidatus Peregrinibacteria bacterium]MBT5823542.1 septum formation initiator family protein [Candidatus Peregrinibacteria bacterium]